MLDALRRARDRAVGAVQRALVGVSLFLLYVLGLGITKALVAVFDRRLLGRRDPEADTYWTDAEGCSPGMEQLERGS